MKWETDVSGAKEALAGMNTFLTNNPTAYFTEGDYHEVQNGVEVRTRHGFAGYVADKDGRCLAMATWTIPVGMVKAETDLAPLRALVARAVLKP